MIANNVSRQNDMVDTNAVRLLGRDKTAPASIPNPVLPSSPLTSPPIIFELQHDTEHIDETAEAKPCRASHFKIGKSTRTRFGAGTRATSEDCPRRLPRSRAPPPCAYPSLHLPLLPCKADTDWN